jgi:hypothetical protein
MQSSRHCKVFKPTGHVLTHDIIFGTIVYWHIGCFSEYTAVALPVTEHKLGERLRPLFALRTADFLPRVLATKRRALLHVTTDARLLSAAPQHRSWAVKTKSH